MEEEEGGYSRTILEEGTKSWEDVWEERGEGGFEAVDT